MLHMDVKHTSDEAVGQTTNGTIVQVKEGQPALPMHNWAKEIALNASLNRVEN